MYNGASTYTNLDNMRIEIAILQEDIPAFIPRVAKFRIPVLMTEDTVTNVTTSNANISNKRNGNIGSSQISIDNTVDLYVPYECVAFYGEKSIPKNTKFLIAFIGANINDARVIGRYDKSTENITKTLAEYITEIIDLDGREARLRAEIAELRSELNAIRSLL